VTGRPRDTSEDHSPMDGASEGQATDRKNRLRRVILNLVDQMHGLRKALADILQSVHERSSQPDAGSS
jgi:hypothetical protein